MGRLVLLCGLPGSGKTTVARSLVAAGAVRLSPDEWMQALGFEAYDADARLRVEALQWSVAQELADGGATVVLENGFWSRAERDLVRDWARSRGHAVELRFLDAPVAELRARVRRRNDELPPGEFLVDPDDLVEWSTMIERPDADELALYDGPN